MDKRTESAWWALRIGLGLGPLLAGIDKFFNVLTDWSMYLSPWAVPWLPIAPVWFMRAVGVVEIAVGLAVLAATRWGAWVAAAWLVAIAVNLASTGLFYDLAVRDLEIAVGFFALARLTEARQAAGVSHPAN